MATNQLLPFASGESPNVIPFNDWNSLPARLTGFQSGIASSQQFNYILAQGGVAGYILGQLIVDQLNQDATLDPDTLYTNWKSAIAKFIPENVADGSIDAKKLLDASISFAKLASTAIATTEEAKAGTANNKLMTPQLVAQAIAEQLPPSIPTGMLLPFAANYSPVGCLLCNGAAVSRTTYAALFAAIGTTYGSGDGSTTFSLPDLTDRFIQGSGTAGTVKSAGLPNIKGEVANDAQESVHTGAFEPSVTAIEKWIGNWSSGSWERVTKAVFDASNWNGIYGASSTVQPPALTMRYYIKY